MISSPSLKLAAEYMRMKGWVITSRYRPSGTHRYGAIDFGPRTYPEGSLAESGTHGYTDARPIITAAQVQTRFPELQVYLEKDHIHIQDPALLPAPLRNASPSPGVERTDMKRGSKRVFIPWCQVDAYPEQNLVIVKNKRNNT